MAEPVKDYSRPSNDLGGYNPNQNQNNQFQNQNPMINNNNNNINNNNNYGFAPPPPPAQLQGQQMYNQQEQPNMGYNGMAPPPPYMGQPIGQPIMIPPPQMNGQDQGLQQQQQFGQPPQMGIPQNSQPPSMYSNNNNMQGMNPQYNQGNQAQYPGYQPPNYAQGVPIEAQAIRINQGNMNQPLITNLDHCEQPTAFRCNFCQKDSVSTMTVEPGTGTWMACCCLCCCFGVFGLIPFCSDSCQDKKHFCPFCGAQVGFKEFKPC